jgi:hypothetical protein
VLLWWVALSALASGVVWTLLRRGGILTGLLILVVTIV